MTSSWMLASLLASALLAAAAMTWERVVTLKRGLPLRWTWVVAMALAAGYSGAWLMPSAAPMGAGQLIADQAIDPTRTTAGGEVTARVQQSAPPTPAEIRTAWSRLRSAVRLPQLPASVDRNIQIFWGSLSSLLLLALAWSSARLMRERRAWHTATIRNLQVLVSDGFGPAIVGVLRPTIVVPPWVLTLDVVAQETILAHEEEHRRAGDPRLLLAGLGFLVLMPWNVGLWMMWRRLGRAIELDCDERVIARGVPDAAYASVLLGAWQRAHGDAMWVPSPAFAEHASGLGQIGRAHV